MLFEAIKFAVDAHKNQFRKGTNIPYIVHPINVMKTLGRLTDEQNVIIAGLLHDILEDTNVTENDIKTKFGEDVLYLVKKASEAAKLENSTVSKDWKSRKQSTIEHLKKEKDERVMLIACADKLDNVSDIIFDYEKSGEKLWQKFNAGKEKQLWYYNTLAEIFKSRQSEFGEAFKQLSNTFYKQIKKLKL